MFWVIDSCLYSEEGRESLTNTLDRFDIPYEVVGVMNDGSLRPEISVNGSIIVCGSYSLSRLSQIRGWMPGTFLNDQHEHRIWEAAYGEHLLNVGAMTAAFGLVDPPWEKLFVRPCEDSKAFSGKVLTREAFLAWRIEHLRDKPESLLKAATQVLVAPLKTILREARIFVVDGVLVAWSTYKQGGKMVLDANVDEDGLEFARRMVALWVPARAFVLDIALLEHGEWRIVEINNINSAGFYAADVQRLVMSLEMMAEAAA